MSAERVAAAARATLDAGSARVWECEFSDPLPPPERSSTRYGQGVADLANVRARMQETSAPVWDYFADRILERFPWLDDDEPDDDEDFEPVTVYAGTAGFLGNGDRWMPLGLDHGDADARRRSARDPLWILEALTNASEAEPRASDPVREVPCDRLRFEVDLRRADAQLDEREREGHSHRVSGDVWIDADERVRRVTWQRPSVRRPRSPVKLPRVTHWRTVELWDFGIEVHIEIPTPMEPPPERPLVHELYDGLGWLWRRKRAYERRTER